MVCMLDAESASCLTADPRRTHRIHMALPQERTNFVQPGRRAIEQKTFQFSYELLLDNE